MTRAGRGGDRRVCLGAIAGAHGVRGAMRIKTFTETPEGVAAYGPVESEDARRRFTLSILRTQADGVVIAGAPEVTNREDAQSLKGVRLYVARDALPAPDEDEFYLDDLVGLAAVDETGAPRGRVAAVYNFGAGDLLELRGAPGEKGARLVPFTRAAVPAVDLDAHCITVALAALDDGTDRQDGDGAEEDLAEKA